MNVYILDWNGTLDTLGNPKGFVRALQSLGHKVVLYTGHSQIKDPAAAACDRYAVKFSLRELIHECLFDWPETAKVYISDDERVWTMETVENLATDPDMPVPVEFLDPFDLNKHLSSMA